MVLFALVFLLFGILVWIAAGVLVHFRRRQLRGTGLMRRLETSSVAQVAGASPGTVVEVKGSLRCEKPLKSEMAGQECAYYRSQVIREYFERDLGDDDIGPDRRSETIASNERFAPFAVEDGSGAVGVRGEGAEVDALEVMNRFERDTQGGITIGGVTMNLGGGGLPRPRPSKGLLFDRASIKRAGCLFPFVLASAVGLAAACAGLGWALTSIDGLTAYLATTPGGIDSVAIMALASGADAPLVLAVQTMRLFAVVLAGALLGRWWPS